MPSSTKDNEVKKVESAQVDDESRPFLKSDLFIRYIIPGFVLRLIMFLLEWKVGLFTDIDYRIFTEAG